MWHSFVADKARALSLSWLVLVRTLNISDMYKGTLSVNSIQKKTFDFILELVDRTVVLKMTIVGE